jgi:hemin uptake protein HemP
MSNQLKPTNSITQADIDKSFEDFNVFDKVDPAVIPTPTRMFELEETVRLGGLDDIQVKEILHDGKAYRLEFTRTGKNERRHPIATRETRCSWWFDVKKMDFSNEDADELFAPYLPGQISTTAVESLISMMAHNGVVCDPRYQRGYVWSIDDQRNLIDSMFNRVAIGSFIFSRHAGYHHKDDSVETVKYINLDGDEVEILRRKDYTSAVIDGQQRMTTIWRFMTNQFTYRGRYWRDLNFRDQVEFKSINVSTRTFDEEDVPYEAVLRMFIKTNKGVPQDEKHLQAVADQLTNLLKGAGDHE